MLCAAHAHARALRRHASERLAYRHSHPSVVCANKCSTKNDGTQTTGTSSSIDISGCRVGKREEGRGDSSTRKCDPHNQIIRKRGGATWARPAMGPRLCENAFTTGRKPGTETLGRRIAPLFSADLTPRCGLGEREVLRRGRVAKKRLPRASPQYPSPPPSHNNDSRTTLHKRTTPQARGLALLDRNTHAMRDEDDGDASVNASAAADAPAVDRWTQQAISARERSLAAKRAQRRDAVSQFLEGVRLPFGIKLNRAAPTNDASGDDSTTSAGAANSHIHADRKEYDAKRDQPQQQQQQQARPPSVAVVGASLSGLVAAFRLKQAGANVTVFESRDAARGSVVTRYEDGFLWEEALDACRDDHPCVRKLIRDLNLVDQVSWPSSRQRAEDGYLVRRGNRSHVAPRGLGSFLTTNLVSPGGKLRAIAEPFAWRRRRRRRRLLSWKGSEAVAADDGIDADEESASDSLLGTLDARLATFCSTRTSPCRTAPAPRRCPRRWLCLILCTLSRRTDRSSWAWLRVNCLDFDFPGVAMQMA